MTQEKTNNTPSSNGFIKFIGGVIFFILHFGLWTLVWLFIGKVFYSLQELIYKRPGEILIGSNRGMIPGLMVAAGITYFVFMKTLFFVKKHSPNFYNAVNNTDKNYSINKKSLNKLDNFVFGLICVSFFLMGICLNAYIALGDKYIAASSIGFLNNRKEYSYGDIMFSKQIQQDGTHQSEVFMYSFPDGKSLDCLGSRILVGNDLEVIKEIQEKQKSLGLNVSEITIWRPKGKENAFINILIYLISGSVFFFIPWTLNKLLKRNKVS